LPILEKIGFKKNILTGKNYHKVLINPGKNNKIGKEC